MEEGDAGGELLEGVGLGGPDQDGEPLGEPIDAGGQGLALITRGLFADRNGPFMEPGGFVQLILVLQDIAQRVQALRHLGMIVSQLLFPNGEAAPGQVLGADVWSISKAFIL